MPFDKKCLTNRKFKNCIACNCKWFLRTLCCKVLKIVYCTVRKHNASSKKNVINSRKARSKVLIMISKPLSNLQHVIHIE